MPTATFDTGATPDWNESTTIRDLLRARAVEQPVAHAILAPDRTALPYHDLDLLAESTVRQLRAAGVARRDRVAMVLRDGPETAAAFACVAAGAACAPLNPAYRASEFDFYLEDLRPRALLIQRDIDSPVRDIACRLGIRLIELERDPSLPAGEFRLHSIVADTPAEDEAVTPDDVALVLHTSGTTSRPKIVPLSQRNICASAGSIARWLALGPDDRCLNVMPLFHIHGLMAAVLASLHAGSAVVCTEGFRADRFFEWIAEFRPTWYTAVPTMHQAVLARIEREPGVARRHRLRFIRSSSASLPPPVMQRLEQEFDAPVIEAYGMTEAAHQMASNPLPPRARKMGSVGVAAGPEVAIMDAAGTLLPRGQGGEIVIRGPGVTRGYEANPAANAAAFSNGWFRTGDEGVLDEEGYLSITGRLKEMINRGGEKVVPREIDEALLAHPDVAQAVAFAAPHARLGEDVMAAVVLRPGAATSAHSLRAHAFDRLAAFKVPSRIVIVDEIPRGPTGKIQRIGLARTLGERLDAAYSPPSDAREQRIATIWAAHLGIERVGRDDNFFQLGGDSLVAAAAAEEIGAFLGSPLAPATLFRAPTIALLCEELARENENREPLLAIRREGSQAPLFCVPGHGGNPIPFHNLARHLSSDVPVYAFCLPALAAGNDRAANAMVAELADSFLREMRALQPRGPYRLLGYCYGGEVAAEMATRLYRQDERFDLLAMVSVPLPCSIRLSWRGRRRRYARAWREFIARSALGKLKQAARFLLGPLGNPVRRVLRMGPPELDVVPLPRRIPGPVTLFRPQDQPGSPEQIRDPRDGWDRVTRELEVVDVPGDRDSIFAEPRVAILAQQVQRRLRSN